MPDRRRVTFLVLALRFSIALIAFAAAELLCERVWPAAGGMPIWVVVITMGLVGLVFALTARSVSRLADRVVLRDHADGYEAGRRLLHRMSTALPVEDVLPALAEITGRTLQVDRSEVRVRLDGGRSLSQVWPEKADPHGEPMVVPVRHDGGTVGEIEVDVPGVASSREAELLRQLVSPAGLAMSTVRLTVELQRRAAALGHVALAIAESNHRIGRARQIESAAVGAEIRDRVDPHLDSAIELIERASTRDGGATTDSDGMAAVAAVERAREEIGQGLDELRNLARRIYPPRLQDGGLTAALEGWQLGTDTGLDVQVDPRVDQDGPIRADAAIQSCLYFLIVASVQHCPRSVPRQSVLVGVQLDRVVVEVVGSTLGVPASRAGDDATVSAIRDRVEAFGGEVNVIEIDGLRTVRAWLPLDEREGART